jgi:hypothetical protein
MTFLSYPSFLIRLKTFATLTKMKDSAGTDDIALVSPTDQ